MYSRRTSPSSCQPSSSQPYSPQAQPKRLPSYAPTQPMDAHVLTSTPRNPQRTPQTPSASRPRSLPAPWRLRTSPTSSQLSHVRPRSQSFAPGLFPLPPPLGGEGEGSLRLPRVFFNTSSEWPRRPDERCRPARTNRPPPSGEDGYVYPTGTASSVSWRVTHTHTHAASLVLLVTMKNAWRRGAGRSQLLPSGGPSTVGGPRTRSKYSVLSGSTERFDGKMH